MPDKVKLPREVAEALESLEQTTYLIKDAIMWAVIHERHKRSGDERLATILDFIITGENIFLLADALRYGYEVEPEPITVTITTEMQEKIAQYYANLDPDTQEDGFDREFVLGERSAVRFTLKMLGIKIPGVPTGE